MTKRANGWVRALAAEFIGTFALIFVDAGVAIELGVNHDPAVAFVAVTGISARESTHV